MISSSLSINNNNNNNANPKQQPLIPPIQPFSPQEISTFTALDLALRSHPELAREGASLGLNPRALAKLVHGMKMFQDAHLGRVSSSSSSMIIIIIISYDDYYFYCNIGSIIDVIIIIICEMFS